MNTSRVPSVSSDDDDHHHHLIIIISSVSLPGFRSYPRLERGEARTNQGFRRLFGFPMALFLVPALHSALLVPSSGLLRSSSSALSMQSLNARSSYGSIIRADEPEIEPSRRKDPSPGRFVPLPTVGAGDDKMDVMSRLLKDRARLPPCACPSCVQCRPQTNCARGGRHSAAGLAG